MSSSLYWAPPPAEVKDHPIDLKYEIGKYLDEEYRGESIEYTFGPEIIPFLKGIAAVGDRSKSAAAISLIKAIEKYGTVQIYTRS